MAKSALYDPQDSNPKITLGEVAHLKFLDGFATELAGVLHVCHVLGAAECEASGCMVL